ncbi:MAG: O-antigen ligase family protein [Oscillospiraceae bacterium]|nr:O-antigen ligase family protein [Oscillospiraceae bacterium]
MNNPQQLETLPEKSAASRTVEILTAVSIVIFTLWQGSYFPLQFLLMLALLLASLIATGCSLRFTKEAAMLLGIFALYCASLLFLSENRYIGLTETLRTLIFPLSLILFLSKQDLSLEKPLLTAFLIIAAFGFLEVSGLVHMPGGMDEGRGRLHSTLQYANATALLMLIGMLYTVGRLVSKIKISDIICFAVFSTALFLTGSRTTLVIGIAICTLFAFIMTNRKGKLITAGAAGFIVIAVILLGIFTDIRIFRLSLVTSTLVERWITYVDAFEMLRERWFLGIGAGNWQHWQFRYQTAPYFVRFIHNYYLQLFLDGGILAPILFIAALFPAIYKGIRSKSIHALILLAFALHGILDTTPIFPAITVIAMYSMSKLLPSKKSFDLGKFRFLAIIPLLIVLVLWSSEFLSIRANVELGSGDRDAAMRSSRAAYALNPLNTDLYMQMSRSAPDSLTREHYIRMAVAANPSNLLAVSALVQIETRMGNYNTALELSSQLVRERRFSAAYQQLHRQTANLALENGAISTAQHGAIVEDIENIAKQINPLFTRFHMTEIPD